MTQTSDRVMIIGPTASGKTDVAVRLARMIDGEIISVDSRQCYRLIDIGTAKPDADQLQQVPHHNISVLDLEESDTATAFLERATEWERDITGRGRRVIYAGGSTLHLQGLIQPFDPVPGPDPENLEHLQQVAESEGVGTLFERLEAVDPEYARRMNGLNRNRIIRALDVWMQTERPFSSFHRQTHVTKPDDLQVFGLRWPRKMLYDRINRRVDQMIGQGLLEETRSIIDSGYSPRLQSLQTVGYRDAIDYLDGTVTFDEMVRSIKTHTRRYAKRQLTWFRRWPFVRWLPADGADSEELARIIAADLNKR